jgi:hypothetical protein
MPTRHIYEGTNGEAMTATIRSNVTLSAQTIELSLNAGSTWITATWQGAANTVRKATITLTPGNTPAADDLSRPVYARIGGASGVIFKVEDEVVVHNV